MSAHTPGPWKVAGLRLGCGEIVGPKGEDIGYANESDGADEAEFYPVEANARLMAAAPDLLKVARAAFHALASYEFGNAAPDLAESVNQALLDAIAKAEGAK